MDGRTKEFMGNLLKGLALASDKEKKQNILRF